MRRNSEHKKKIEKLVKEEYIIIDYVNYEIEGGRGENNLPKNTHLKEYIVVDKIDCPSQIINPELLNRNTHANEEIIVAIYKDLFINKTREGFKNENEIWEQFKKDLIRSKYYINNNELSLENIDLFRRFLEIKYSQETVNEILMLCTQASMAFPFELIQYSLNNKYLSEMNFSEKKNKDYLKILIFTDEQCIKFNISKTLRIFLFDSYYNDVTENYITLNIEFDLKNDEYILMKLNLSK